MQRLELTRSCTPHVALLQRWPCRADEISELGCWCARGIQQCDAGVDTQVALACSLKLYWLGVCARRCAPEELKPQSRDEATSAKPSPMLQQCRLRNESCPGYLARLLSCAGVRETRRSAMILLLCFPLPSEPRVAHFPRFWVKLLPPDVGSRHEVLCCAHPRTWLSPCKAWKASCAGVTQAFGSLLH